MSLATHVGSGVGHGAAGTDQGSPVRLALIDSDSGFVHVVSRRLESRGWHYRVLASPVPLETMVSMRLNAVVLDLAALGSDGWSYLERLCSSLPGLGIVVCTGQSTVAQRVRGLRLGVDDWLAPGSAVVAARQA